MISAANSRDLIDTAVCYMEDGWYSSRLSRFAFWPVSKGGIPSQFVSKLLFSVLVHQDLLADHDVRHPQARWFT